MDFINSDLFKLIILGVFCVVNFFLVIFKKKPASNLIDSIYSSVLQLLPGLIAGVEVPGNGQEKKLKVLESGLAIMAKSLGRELTADEKIVYATKLSSQIEAILSTPTKKEEVKK